jgi:hypothetical protein
MSVIRASEVASRLPELSLSKLPEPAAGHVRCALALTVGASAIRAAAEAVRR